MSVAPNTRQIALMRKAPPRTHASELTDDELVIFDFLWRDDAPRHMLYKEPLAVHANTPYSHSIPDEELGARLFDLVDRDLLRMHTSPPRAGRLPGSEESVGLTKRGFEAWESERRPDWTRYIEDSWEDDCLTVAALSAELGSRFIEVCRESGVWNIGEETARCRVERHVSLVRWKTFDEVHYFELPVPEGTWRPTNWTLYESKRVWWGNVAELGSLVTSCIRPE